MRNVFVLVVAVALTVHSRVEASPRFLPQPSAEPLGVLVGNSKTIHTLKVKASDEKSVAFETTKALKGKLDEAPFHLLKLQDNTNSQGLFKIGETILCFTTIVWETEVVAILHVGTRWALAISPDIFHGSPEWFSYGEYNRSSYLLGDFSVTFDGPDEVLREHVAAILAGRETTITTRAPKMWDARGSARLWRIKASLNITDFVMSDESPYFVGWGTGEKDEVPKLLNALKAAAARDRIGAADDLAHLGKAAREALPGLRCALKDAEPGVVRAAAKAVARLDAEDTTAVKTIEAGLRHADAQQRAAAASALADLGPRAGATLLTLLPVLADKEESVRAAAAEAVGQIAPGSPFAADTVVALATLVKDEKTDSVRIAAIRSLLRFGPQAQVAIPALRKSLSMPSDERGSQYADAAAVALLARFNPVPVELLAEIAADRRSTSPARTTAIEQLERLGPRAWAARPTLLQVLQESQQPDGPDIESLHEKVAWALLTIDPDGAPAVLIPMFLERVKKSAIKGTPRDYHLFNAIGLLGRCGAAAKPSLPVLLAAVDTMEQSDAPYAVSNLTSLLTPKDRELLPKLRQKFGDNNELRLASALLKLGYPDEALTQVTMCLENDNRYCRTHALKWLRERPRESKSVLPALRQAQGKASGTERVRLALTLWRLNGGGEDSPRTRALAGLDDLLAVLEYESHLVGYLNSAAFWSEHGPRGISQEDALGNAIDEVYCRVQASSDTVTLLTRLLGEQDMYLRLAAVAALARTEPNHSDIVPALRRLLERHPDVFPYVAEMLASLGPKAAPLVPLLLPNLRHPNDDVYRVTDRVLRRIDPALAAKGWGAEDVPGAVSADLDSLWDDLASNSSERADVAAWRLAGAGPRTVALLRERLRPPPTLGRERVARLIADLDNNDFAIRERASSELAAGIESAALYVRRALAADPSPESRRRLDGLLTGLDAASTADQRRRLRGVRLLEAMDTTEALDLLKSLSRGDPQFRLTREAATALRRLDPSLAGSNRTASQVLRRVKRIPAQRLARS